MQILCRCMCAAPVVERREQWSGESSGEASAVKRRAQWSGERSGALSRHARRLFRFFARRSQCARCRPFDKHRGGVVLHYVQKNTYVVSRSEQGINNTAWYMYVIWGGGYMYAHSRSTTSTTRPRRTCSLSLLSSEQGINNTACDMLPF